MNVIPPHLSAILERLGQIQPSKDGFMARCPAHDDHTPSLSIKLEEDSKILLHCFAECTTESILAALGLSFPDLFAPESPQSKHTRTRSAAGGRRAVSSAENRASIGSTIVMPPANAPGESTSIYNYTDENGTLLFRIIRIDGATGKRIYAEQPDSRGGWTRSLAGVLRVLYNLPTVLQASEAGKRVYVVEGEKNADDLTVLGLTSTTNPHGAGTWNTYGSSYSEALQGADVVILYDNDTPGKRHRDDVAKSLHGIARSIRVVELPDLKKGEDVSDWLSHGGTREELERLVDAVPVWSPTVHLLKSMRIVRAADVQPEKVSWLWSGYLAKGKITIADGNPGEGKSTVALDLAARISIGESMPDGSLLVGPANVVIMAAEDGIADTIIPRLIAAGADLSRVFLLLEILEETGPRIPEFPRDLDKLHEMVSAYRAELVIIDPLMAYLGSNIDTHRDQEVRRALTPLKAMAETTGAAILAIRHCSKAQGVSTIHKGGGSVGIIAAARIGWLFAPDPNSPPDIRRMVIAVTKSNIGPMPSALLYHTEHDESGACSRLVWDGASAFQADDLTSSPPDAEERSARQEAIEFLRDMLKDGPVPSNELIAQAAAAGISERTLRRAKDILGVDAKRGHGPMPGWKWSLKQPGK